MKKYSLALLVLWLSACGKKQESITPTPVYTEESTVTPQELGKSLFNGKGKCASCHLPDKKVIAPSIKEISDVYKAKKQSIVPFLKEETQPIIDPLQYSIMQTNFAITKKMTDEELQALEAYMFNVQ